LAMISVLVAQWLGWRRIAANRVSPQAARPDILRAMHRE
jgi:hypothetical protein